MLALDEKAFLGSVGALDQNVDRVNRFSRTAEVRQVTNRRVALDVLQDHRDQRFVLRAALPRRMTVPEAFFAQASSPGKRGRGPVALIDAASSEETLLAGSQPPTPFMKCSSTVGGRIPCASRAPVNTKISGRSRTSVD